MAISVVQSKVISAANSGSLTSATTAGNCIVVAYAGSSGAGGGGGLPAVSGMTLGGAADNFAAVKTQNESANSASISTIWMDPACAGGQTAIAVSGTNLVAADAYMLVLEVAGLGTSPTLDKSSSGPLAAGTTTWTSNATGVTIAPAELIVGVTAHGPNSANDTLTGPASPWINGAAFKWADGAAIAGYQIAASTGSFTYSGTSTTFDYYTCIVATINPGGVASSAPSPVALPGPAWRRRFKPYRQTPPMPSPVQAVSATGAVSGAGALAAVGRKNASGTSSISGTGLPAALLPAIVQQVAGSSTFDYGLSTVEIDTTAGNTLVVLAGWDLSTQPTSAAMPAVYVTDSAGNYWYHAGTTTSTVTGSRSAAWVCVNSRPIEWLSVSLSTFASSLAYTVLEVANMPMLYSVDVAAANAVPAATTLPVLPGSTTGNDIAFSLLTAGASGLTAPSTPAGWTALTTVTSGAGSANPVQIFPFWQPLLSTGGSANTTWTVGQQVPLSGVTFTISNSPPAVVQPNPNMPAIKAEAAFGYLPGDPSQPPPTWTDISASVIGTEGGTYATSVMGREYELAQAEAGELHLALNNQAGAFTPGNSASPYYPDVVLGTPVRLSAYWAGHWYYLGTGYTERWPQTWPDLPQWGISPLVATDPISVMASATMVAALDADLLLDAPYVFLPCSEQYTTFVGGINPTFTAADAQGLLANNASRVNQRAAAYVDGTLASADTGQATNMLGDSDSGFGTSSITTAPTIPASGPGVVYTDPNLPGPTSTNGVTVEFWLIIPTTVASTKLQPVVFTAYGPPSNYSAVTPSLQVQIDNFTSSATLTVTLANGSTVTAPFTASANAQQIVLTLTQSSLSIYVNGALQATATLSVLQTTPWNGFGGGCANYAYASGLITAGNFTMFDIAVYPYILPPQRISSHYVTGSTGQQGVDATSRVAQILAWANLGFARGGQVLFGGGTAGVSQGPAYDLSGKTAADAVNQVAANEGGLIAAMPSGALVFIHKWALLNQTPVAVLGDAPNPAAGEIPFLQPTSWGYDNTYVYNVTQATQTVGPNTTITASAADFVSQREYFTRSALQQTIETTSNLDAYDTANWAISKYSQPQLRVSGLQVDAASNPAAAFPVILALQQGQVVTVTRRPMGGAVITGPVIIQKIQHDIGPMTWTTSLQLSPYPPQDAILQLDTPPDDTLGNVGLA